MYFKHRSSCKRLSAYRGSEETYVCPSLLHSWSERALMTAPQTTIRPFLFGRVQLTDKDDEACNDETVIKGLGSITMKYIRVQNVRKTTTGHHFTPAKTQTVHERAKKAKLSHQVRYARLRSHAASKLT